MNKATEAQDIWSFIQSLSGNIGVGSRSLLQGIFLAQDRIQVSALQADSWPSEPPGKPIQGQMVNKCKAETLSLVFLRPKPGLLLSQLTFSASDKNDTILLTG